MFYSEAILAKKGPLAKVWLAAHWERKLSKNQLLQTDLSNSVDAIMGADQAPMALRLSGQLLLGVARIYSRKAKYLQEDCNEALVKIKVAFRAAEDDQLDKVGRGLNDVATAEQARAAFNAITVPDAMTELDLLVPAQGFDLEAWGIKTNDFDLFRVSQGSDIEFGRHHRFTAGPGAGVGAAGYRTMDFDLAGPEDGLDLDMFGDDLAGTLDHIAKRGSSARQAGQLAGALDHDIEIEVGRRGAVERRSASVDPLGLMGMGDEMAVGKEPGAREPSIARSVHDTFEFGDLPIHDFDGGRRSPLHVDFEDLEHGADDGTVPPVAPGEGPRQPAQAKKRKLIVDEVTEMAQAELMSQQLHEDEERPTLVIEVLPRSRKLLRLQQIESDVAHGGLVGYLLDCSAGPRLMGAAGGSSGGELVPELASMFSRRLQIEQPRPPAVPHDDGYGDIWAQPGQEEEQHDLLAEGVASPPPAEMFEGFQLGHSPVGDEVAVPEGVAAPEEPAPFVEPSAGQRGGLLFAETAEEGVSGTVASTTKELEGVVFSNSTVQAMRLIQDGLTEARKQRMEAGELEAEEEAMGKTRTATHATASSAQNRQNKTRVAFSELMRPSGQTRGEAAKLFFELLVLSTKDVIKVEQEESYGEIKVGGSPWLETLVEADKQQQQQMSSHAGEVQVEA
ncbi:sister chromatid cohesion protein 1 [Actinomortierella wolfii]|nr:sister chromatid cohesion protein 1 [Actinomortierella wolfii]